MPNYFATNTEDCICGTAGDDIGFAISNLNCDGSRIRDITTGDIHWALGFEGDIVLENTFRPANNADYVTFRIGNTDTADLGGRYDLHVRFEGDDGYISTIQCTCLNINLCVIT